MFNVNKIILTVFSGFFLISIYFLFKDFNTTDSLKGYYRIYFYFFLILSIIFFINLFLRDIIKVYFLIIFFSLISSLYLVELYIFKSGNIKLLDRSLDNWENKFYFLQKEIIKNKAYAAFSYEDKNTLSFSGLQNSNILMCNESGYWAKYKSDRHGFNNPDYVWEKKNIDIVFIGDSMTKGECVDQGDEMASQLRIFQKNMNVVNLGWQATGPLRQYAAYKEFIGNKNIKYIFWVYFENDLEDLAIEKNNPILMKYFNNDYFNQNLKDKDVKRKISSLILSKHEEFMKKDYEINKKVGLYSNLINFLKLYKIRQLALRSIHKNFFDNEKINQSLNIEDDLQNFYFSLFDKLRQLTDNQTKIVMVYLPREKYGFTKGYNKSLQIKNNIFENLINRNIDIIDIEDEIKKNFFNPGQLYPKQHVGMHFNEKGYKFIAKKINEYLIKDFKNNAN